MKPPKRQKKSVEEKGEDLSTWSQKRLNQASLREQLYDINFNYLDNKELAAVVTFLTLKNAQGESVRQQKNETPDPEEGRQEIVTAGPGEKGVTDDKIRLLSCKGLKGPKDTRKRHLMNLGSLLNKPKLGHTGKTVKCSKQKKPVVVGETPKTKKQKQKPVIGDSEDEEPEPHEEKKSKPKKKAKPVIGDSEDEEKDNAAKLKPMKKKPKPVTVDSDDEKDNDEKKSKPKKKAKPVVGDSEDEEKDDAVKPKPTKKKPKPVAVDSDDEKDNNEKKSKQKRRQSLSLATQKMRKRTMLRSQN